MAARTGTAVIAIVVAGLSAATVPSGAGPVERGLVVLDARTGRTRWHATVRGDRSLGLAGIGPSTVFVSERACVDGGRGPRPRLMAFDARSGERRWASSGYGGPATKTMVWSQSANVPPAALGVVVATGGRAGEIIPGLDAGTGAVRWRIGRGDHFLGVSSTLVFTSKLTGPSRWDLRGFDRRTGKRRWSFPPAPEPEWGGVFDVVAADRAHVVVANGGYTGRSDAGPSGATTFFVLDARTGKERSRFTAADPQMLFADFVLHDGLLVFGDGPSIVARDIRDGSTVWTRPREGTPAEGTAGQWIDPSVRSATNGSRAYLHRRDSFDALAIESGTTRWTAPGWLYASSRALAVTTLPRGLYAYDATTGAPRWNRRMPHALGRGDEIGVAVGFGARAGRTIALNRGCDAG
jgi:outer membrane protein assembly factor BamB